MDVANDCRLAGTYRLEKDIDRWDGYGADIKVKETEKSYIFELVEMRGRYIPGLLEMLFKDGKRVTIRKENSSHCVNKCDEGNDWFVIYPARMGKPFLFEKISD